MRCTMCNIHYPLSVDVCPVCETETWYDKTVEPDDLWSFRAEQLRQEREGSGRKQPFFFEINVIDYLHDSKDSEPDERGLLRDAPVATPCVMLTDVYAYQNRKQLLQPGEVIELPNPLSEMPGEELTYLYEVQGTFRGPAGSMYMLEKVVIPDYVPREWVEEFYRGD